MRKGEIFCAVISLIVFSVLHFIPHFTYYTKTIMLLLIGWFLVLTIPSFTIAMIYTYFEDEKETKGTNIKNKRSILIGYTERTLIYIILLIIYVSSSPAETIGNFIQFLSIIILGKGLSGGLSVIRLQGLPQVNEEKMRNGSL